jgi:hypothetical protein
MMEVPPPLGRSSCTLPAITSPSSHHLSENGCLAWQQVSDYSRRAKVETAIGRWKQVIGDGLRSRIEACRIPEVRVAVHILNRMLKLGRPNYARVA